MALDSSNIRCEFDSIRFTKSITRAEQDINDNFDKFQKIINELRDRLLKELRMKESEFWTCQEFKQLETLMNNKTQLEDMFRENSQQEILEDSMYRIEQKILSLQTKLNAREVTVKWQLDEFCCALKGIARFKINDDDNEDNGDGDEPAPPKLPPRNPSLTLRSRSKTINDPLIEEAAPRLPKRGTLPPQPQIVRMPDYKEDQPVRLPKRMNDQPGKKPPRVDDQPSRMPARKDDQPVIMPTSREQEPQNYMEMSSTVKGNPFDLDDSTQVDIDPAPRSNYKYSTMDTCLKTRHSHDPLPEIDASYPQISPTSSHVHPPLPRSKSGPGRSKPPFESIYSGKKILGMHIERVVPIFAGCNRGKENDELYKANTVEIDIATSDIYIADTYNHCVKVFSKDGQFKSLFGRKSAGKLAYPYGLCISGKIVYVGEKLSGKIKAFQIDGTFMKEITGDGTKKGGFKFLWGIAANSENGDIYACDNENDRIQVFTSGLEFKRTIIGPTLPGNVTGPVDVKVRNLMIIVLDQSDPCVHYFDTQGVKLWSMVESREAKIIMAPQCFTFDIEDNILITDANSHTIRIFTPKGELYIALGKKGDKVGDFSSPTGIALNNDGNIVSICQREKSNLQIISYST